MDHSHGRFCGGFVVFGHSSIFGEPTEGAFDDPPLRQDFEALHVVRAADDVQADTALALKLMDPPHEFSGVTAVGPDEFEPAESLSQQAQKYSGPVPVLDIRRMYDDQ